MRRTIARFLVLPLALAACANPSSPTTPSDPPSFIVGGTATGPAYGNVGALLLDFDDNGTLDGDDELCSGSLIAPTIFLTAAHCVVGSFAPEGTQFYVSFASDLYAGGITVIPAVSVTADPEFGHSEADLHDLAVVMLPAGSTVGITPLHLPTAGFLDQAAAKNGLKDRVFVSVGYGTDAARHGTPGFPYDGLRKSSESPFSALRPSWLVLKINSSATGMGGDCYGDSGGPKFLRGDVTTIYATVTSGDAPCRSTSVDFRLDTPAARGFLGQFVALP